MGYSGIMTWILKSSFHPLLSRNTLLLAYIDRRRGKFIKTPVNYARTGNVLLFPASASVPGGGISSAVRRCASGCRVKR